MRHSRHTPFFDDTIFSSFLRTCATTIKLSINKESVDLNRAGSESNVIRIRTVLKLTIAYEEL